MLAPVEPNSAALHNMDIKLRQPINAELFVGHVRSPLNKSCYADRHVRQYGDVMLEVDGDSGYVMLTESQACYIVLRCRLWR